MDYSNPFMPYGDMLTEQQRRSATTQGWLGAASALANMSAPRPGSQASLLQLLTAGAQGFTGGAGGYVDNLASHYKPLEEMKQSQAMSDYMQNNPSYTQSLGLPAGMPVSPGTAMALAQKRAEKTGDLQLEQYYKPTTEGMIEQAKNPALVQRAGLEEAAKNPFLIARAGGEAMARLPAERAMSDYSTDNRIREAMNTPKAIEPQGSLVTPSGGVIYKDNRPDAATKKTVGENLVNLQSAQAGLKMLDTMAAVNPTTYDGALAETRSAIAANTYADYAPTNADKKVANTAKMDTLTKKFTLDLLGGKLGVAVSDADRDFIMGMAPKLSDTVEQRAAKIDTLKTFMEDKINGTNNLNDRLLSGTAYNSGDGWSVREVKK